MPAESVEKKRINSKLEKTLESLIESSGKISANMLGMVNRVGGQIYALLFMVRNPLSLDDVCDLLKTSKGNVSVNIRLLEEQGLVRKVWVKGSRKDYYEAVRDYPRKLIRGFFDRVREGIEHSLRLIEQCQTELEQLPTELDKDDREDAEFMKHQLNLLLGFYSLSSQFFDDFYQGKPVDIDILRQATLG